MRFQAVGENQNDKLTSCRSVNPFIALRALLLMMKDKLWIVWKQLIRIAIGKRHRDLTTL